MARPVLLVVFTLSAATLTHAQAPERIAVPVWTEASLTVGRVQGIVHDNTGQAVSGVSVVALGTTAAIARTDVGGRFALELVPGDYVLRASRTGYVSTYREVVRVQTSAVIERAITVTRQSLATAARPDPAQPERAAPVGDTVINEMLWRLRHLPASALRDIAPGTGLGNNQPPLSSGTPSLFGADMKATLNLVTTSTGLTPVGGTASPLPRSVANFAVGAPLGSRGDLMVRGAMQAADLSSWVFMGEFKARDQQTHVFRVGLTYGTQVATAVAPGPLLATTAGPSRTVGGVYGFDRWRVRPGLEFSYGIRLDRDDAGVEGQWLSPRVGLRLAVAPRTSIVASATRRAVVPGAEGFLPPSTEGPWLPPESRVTPLVPGTSLLAERVGHYEFGVQHEFGLLDQPAALGVRRFRQVSSDQIATLFGLDDMSDPTHYSVANAGSVDLDGWGIRAAGYLAPTVRATLDYSASRARWIAGPEALVLAGLAPSAVRAARERIHDLTSSVEANVPQTSTTVTFVYRVNTAFSRAGAAAPLPLLGERFDVELRQALPFHPVRGSQVEVILAVRNLFRDLRDASSLYDELLTVTPPLRVVGGVQIKF